jgi:hypothetical protein
MAAMVERIPVSFLNEQGHRLFGILHLPDVAVRRDTAVVLLSPGVKMRVAPHRLYNHMAARYSELGFPVLRFDFWGLGDSEGEVPETLLADLYGNVQVGRYVSDTRAAMNWLQQNWRVGRFVLGGLCGGAITGLLAAAGDERAVGVLALGLPVTLDGAHVDKTRYVTDGQLRRMRTHYLRKLANPVSWLRLLSFKTDYRNLWRVLRQPFVSKPKAAEASPAAADDDNFNQLFPSAFLRLLGDRRPMLLVFGGIDRLRWEFEEKFLRRYGAACARHASEYRLHAISGANHILSSPEAKAEMLAISQEWLLEQFAAASTAAVGAPAGKRLVPGAI